MEKQEKGNAELLVLISIISFLVLSSSVALAQGSRIVLTPNRFVVLDDPSGWVSSAGDQWNGESTTIRWYVLILNSSGLAAPAGVSVTTYLKYPNGTVFYSASALTDSNGYANFSANLNNLNQITTPGNVEGYWTINATATVDSQSIADSDNFIYNEYGCGKSGSGCHSSNWQSSGQAGPQNVNAAFGTGTKDSPYMMGWDAIHNQSKFGAGYPHGTGSQTIGYGECLTCHKSYNGTYIGASSRDNFQPQYAGGLHAGKTNAACTDCHAGFVPNGVYVNMPIKTCYDCHPKKNNNLTVQVYAQSSTQGYSYLPLNTANGNIRAHDSGDTVACITCHDSGHNISKPYNATDTSNTYTEYQQCTACHQSYSQHNNSVSCTVCHSQDAHVIKVLAQNATYISGSTSPDRGNCTDCHQNPSFMGTLLTQPKAGSYSGNAAPIIPDPLKHSSNVLNGTIWGTYWASEQGSCYYCHTNTKHNSTALGSISGLLADPTNIKNGATTITTWCADCHYNDPVNTNYLGNRWTPAPPTITVDNTGKSGWQNHNGYLSGGYKDSDCQNCHALSGTYSSTSLNLSHSLNVGQAGGPNCISCHNLGGSAGAGRLVNFSAMNDTNAIHKNLNSGATSPSGYSSANFRCWACHGSGNEPGSGHPSNYRTPYRCPDCHVQSAGQNLNFTPAAILNVTQHYWNGTSIKTAAVSSCYDCHNKSEMMVGLNLDPDGAASVYGGANGGSNSTSHYGKKRLDYPAQSTNDYCYQCHKNASTAFPFIDNSNKTIANHSTNYASSPNCADCHATQAGRVHNSTLYKPAFSLPNSTYCMNCHGTAGSASIKNKEQHNGTLDCTQCHLNDTRSIHPVRYLQQDGISWNTIKTNAVNCTNCHQGTGLGGFAGAPKVPQPVNHSTDPYSGKKWGSYWDNTSGITACYYCHQNEIHKNNTVLFGNVSTIKGSNTLNNPDLANSTWCANCHYAGAQGYKGNLIANPPPEITNSSLVASDGTIFFNHSGLTNFNDSNCKNCHGRALSGYSETSLNLSHSVSEGGGDDCVGCHGTNYIGASPSVTRTFVNISAFNESIHQNLNATPLATVNNLDCWSCHYIKDMNRQNIKKCGDCHRKPSQWHGNANITTNLSQLW